MRSKFPPAEKAAYRAHLGKNGGMAKNVIWDMGGTLMDTYPSIDRLLLATVEQKLAETRSGGASTPAAPSLRDIALLTRGGITRAIGILAKRYGIDPGATATAHEAMKRSWQATTPPPVMAGARATLAAVRERGGLNLIVTHRDRASAELLLARAGLAIDDMICQPDGYARKPAPDMYLVMLDRHRLRPADCLTVGDRAIDALAGLRAAVAPVLLETPGVPLDEVDIATSCPEETREISYLLSSANRISDLDLVTRFL